MTEQKSCEAVLALTMQLHKLRLPTAEREKSENGGVFENRETEAERVEQMRWLFGGVPSTRGKDSNFCS